MTKAAVTRWNFQLKLVCNGAPKQVSAGVAPCNIKRRNLFRNVEIGLKMNHGRLGPVSDWLTQRSVTRPSKTSFTKWCYMVKLWFFSPLTGKSNQFSTQELLWFFCGFYLVYDRNPFLEKVPFFHIGKFAIPCVEF